MGQAEPLAVSGALGRLWEFCAPAAQPSEEGSAWVGFLSFPASFELWLHILRSKVGTVGVLNSHTDAHQTKERRAVTVRGGWGGEDQLSHKPLLGDCKQS